jgi:hypothetical protein
MNSIKVACTLNNQGLDLLVSGDSSRAITVFQNALCLLENATHETETTSCTEMNMISRDDTSMPFCESTSTVSSLQDLHCYVYNHGISISDNDLKGNADTDETLSLYIAIVLFNLALTSHSEGMALGQERSLRKASVLYTFVVQLVTRCTMPETVPPTILTLLALNNKAQIHYDQTDYVQSVDCMQEISKIMGSSVHGLHSALRLENVEGLLRNVMLLITPTAAQAA